MSRMLASVATPQEMELARDGGADVVDLKNPAEGALGAWPPAVLEAAVARWRAWPEPRPWLSATIGDQPMEPDRLRLAAESVAATGVPIVKVGLLPSPALDDCLHALRPLTGRVPLIAVLFADTPIELAAVEQIAVAGFFGAMFDTADKTAGGLLAHRGTDELARFVERVKALGLVSGLAGSLKLADIPALLPLGADYLGFRGALCRKGRTGALDPAAMRKVRAAVR